MEITAHIAMRASNKLIFITEGILGRRMDQSCTRYLSRNSTTHMEVYLYVDFDKICTRIWCIYDAKTSEIQETKHCERAHVLPGG